MDLYMWARPNLMASKKILYVHGFASSGQSGTVKALRVLLPSTVIIAPDLPVEPGKAMALLEDICSTEKPDLIIGSSMGGMYAERLKGFPRILVNPAFCLADTLLKNNGLGRQQFHNPREDGETSFLVTKGLLEEFRECSSKCFDGIPEIDPLHPTPGDYLPEQEKVWGLFGTRDTLVDTYPLFASRYPNAVWFDGEHYLNDHALLHSVLPIIQRIEDAVEGRTRKSILIGLEDTLADLRHSVQRGKDLPEAEPENSALKAFATLSQDYQLWVLATAPFNHPEKWGEAAAWVRDNLGTAAYDRVILSNRKDMILGDYVIDRYPSRFSLPDSMGTVIEYGSDTFRTWEDVLEYFGRLGGQ